MSVLFAALASSAMLLTLGGPALHRAAAAVQKCDLAAPRVAFPDHDD